MLQFAIDALLGVALLIAGVGLWLLSWRAAALTLASVVVSLTAAGLVLQWRGETFNAMTFLGLTAGAVLLAYDAVHTATAQAVAGPGGGAASAHDAPALPGLRGYALAIGLAWIVPVAVVEGRPGAFITPAVSAYVVALLASFVVGMTVTPALASLLARGASARPAPLAARMGAGYGSRIARLAGGPIAMVAVGVLALVTVAGAALVPSNLVPTLQDRNVQHRPRLLYRRRIPLCHRRTLLHGRQIRLHHRRILLRHRPTPLFHQLIRRSRRTAGAPRPRRPPGGPRSGRA